MRDKVHSAILFETCVVLAPKPIHSVGLSYHGLDHFWLVMRKIIRNIKHDITDEISHRRNSLRCDIFETVLVGRRSPFPRFISMREITVVER